MNSKYDGRSEREILEEGYRIANCYDDVKLYRRNGIILLASVKEGKLEVLVQMKINEETKSSWKKFWRK